MMKLWERNDAPPHVDAPGAGTRPYLVLCRRPPEDGAAASGREGAPGDHGVEPEAHEDLDLGGGTTHRTATVYQWVRIPR